MKFRRTKSFVGKHPLLPVAMVLILTLTGQAQTLTGSVVDARTGRGISYVNIGIANRRLGTVSNEAGAFRLLVANAQSQDTVRFSCVGYEPLTLLVAKLGQIITIQLSETTRLLQSVKVKAHPPRLRVIGNTKNDENSNYSLTSNDLGSEIATIVTIKKPTFLKTANFIITKNSCGPLVFRVNLYRLTSDGQPTNEKILTQDVITKTDIGKGILTVDLSGTNTTVTEDFCLSLEWIAGGLGKDITKQLYFSCGLGYRQNELFTRYTSQSPWSPFNDAVLGMKPKISFYIEGYQ